MRNILLFVVLSIFIACSSNATEGNGNSSSAGPAESPDIKIQVEGASQGKAYLIGVFADQNFRLDSAQVDASGQIALKRAEPYPTGMVFLALPNQSYLQILIDQDQTFEMKTRQGQLVEAMEVSGSLDNEILYQNLKFEADFQKRLQPIQGQLQGLDQANPQYGALKEQEQNLASERRAHLKSLFTQYPNSLFTKFKKAGQNPEVRDINNPDGTPDQAARLFHYRRDFWNNVDFSDERLIRTTVVSNKLNRYINELTPQHPDSINAAANYLINQVLDYPEYYKFFANWITLQYEPTKTTLMDPEAVYVNMVQNYFTNERAFWADSATIFGLQQRAYEMAQSLVGKKGPDVVSTDQNGNTRKISDIKSPYVVVFMYNPECDHCQEQTPKLLQFYREWKNKGVEVFAIAIDTDQAQWTNFIKNYNISEFINVFDPTNKSIYAKYYVDNTPEIYVLNPDRKIIAKNLKVFQIGEVIEKDKNS